MPLKPDEVHDHALNQRVKEFQEICGFIDENLRNSYDGDRPISITVKVNKGYADDMVLFKMVQTAFEAAGWDVYAIDESSWTFDEKSPPEEANFQLPAARGPYR